MMPVRKVASFTRLLQLDEGLREVVSNAPLSLARA